MTAIEDDALSLVTAALHRSRNRDGGWGYHAGRQSRLEATCWAALGTAVPLTDTPILAWQAPHGLLVEPATHQTNYAFNGLAAVALAAEGSGTSDGAGHVVDALLASKGVRIPPSPAIRQDTTLQGWSWTDGTFTWVEPTAWCLLAVKRLRGHTRLGQARIAEAERVLHDRECTGGGWNFGNGVVYGADLPAHVPPTVAGLIAMQDRPDTALVERAWRFLERQAPREHSLTALAGAVLALGAVGRPVASLLDALAAQCRTSLGLENAAVLGMVAVALRSRDHEAGPRVFTLARQP